jgi:hypothetical protein
MMRLLSKTSKPDLPHCFKQTQALSVQPQERPWKTS